MKKRASLCSLRSYADISVRRFEMNTDCPPPLLLSLICVSRHRHRVLASLRLAPPFNCRMSHAGWFAEALTLEERSLTLAQRRLCMCSGYLHEHVNLTSTSVSNSDVSDGLCGSYC